MANNKPLNPQRFLLLRPKIILSDQRPKPTAFEREPIWTFGQ
jgi:hypothetical protein